MQANLTIPVRHRGTIDRVCSHCSLIFTMRQGTNQVFCSNACRWANSADKRRALRVATCEVCSVEFLKAKPSQIRRFCSMGCRTVSVTGVTYVQVSINCRQCGTIFFLPQSQANGFNSRGQARTRKFCSNACFRAARRSPILTCRHCKRSFTVPRSHFESRGQGKYCSKTCLKADRVTTPEQRRQRITATTQRRRALKQSAPGFATVEQILARIAMFGGMCWMCKVMVGGTIDHVIPLSKGGSNWPANLRPACKSCNSRKHNRSYKDFLVRVA